MRKVYLLGFWLLFSAAIQSQIYPGYRTSNYTGVNGVFFNPANIADSRYKWDVNVFSIDGYVGNNQASLGFKDITKSSFKTDSLKSRFLRGDGANLNSLTRVDILGPSAMFSLSPGTSIAITTRARIWGNARDINGRVVGAIIDAGKANDTYPFTFNTPSSLEHVTGWTEIGASIGQVFSKPGSPHFFKGGLTLKYLAGTADAYTKQENFNGTVNNGVNGTYFTATTGNIALNTTAANFGEYDFNDFFKFNGHGVGGDIGIVYELRPKADYSAYENDRFANKYKLKIGVALLDVGQIKFSKSTNESGNYSMNVPPGQQFLLKQFDGKSISDFKSIFDNSPYFTALPNSGTDYSVSLPMSLQANIDYQLRPDFYVNASGQFALSKTDGINLYAINSYSLTPRWENVKFGVALPVNYNELSQWNVGLSLRAGPVFLGSGSVITALFDNSKQADLHLGVRFGMPYKKKLKPDTDKDGVYDNVDKCPNDSGVARYQGCPIPDTDRDGVNDEVDSCITIAGLIKYHGCPIPDRDKDGVNDEIDLCPDVPGSGQFQGCPDTDGDGIPDKDDKCPTVAGLVKYQGCPVPDRDQDGVNDEEDLCPDKAGPASSKGCPVEHVLILITADFTNILFNTGKSTIKPASKAIIVNAATTMKEQIPNASFYVDGYTDNVGNTANNKKLSKARAQSVANALIAAGVDKSRITVRGFGKDNPKCSNKTEEGRACNRRVEVVLRNPNQ